MINVTIGDEYTEIKTKREDVDTMPELLNVFHDLAIGLTYMESSWRRAIIDLADEYREEDEENG